jgi:hypothetical protein
MPTYKAPVEDLGFLLNDVFQVDRYDNLPGFSDASAETREPIFAEAAKLTEHVLAPLNLPGDQEGCRPGRLYPPRRRPRHHAERIQGRLPSVERGRLDRAFVAA